MSTKQDRPLLIAGVEYRSRLIIGSGKYKDFEENLAALEASAAEMITVAIRRVNLGQDKDEPSLLDIISPEKYTILPNTAGCYNAEDAVRTCRMARELLDGHKLVKLEVLGDQKTLYPNVTETLAAAETLVAEGFDVMVYTSDDPLVARRLEEIGCVAVMPLGAPIGSGLGIRNPYNIRMILENAQVPIIVDEPQHLAIGRIVFVIGDAITILVHIRRITDLETARKSESVAVVAVRVVENIPGGLFARASLYGLARRIAKPVEVDVGVVLDRSLDVGICVIAVLHIGQTISVSVVERLPLLFRNPDTPRRRPQQQGEDYTTNSCRNSHPKPPNVSFYFELQRSISPEQLTVVVTPSRTVAFPA